MKTFSSDDILNRLKAALSVNTDKEMADALGIKKATLSNWRTRNSIDFPLVFSVCEHINKDWLITGEGEMFKPQIESNAVPIGGVYSAASGDDGVVDVEFVPVTAHATFIENLLVPSEPFEKMSIIARREEREEIEKYKVFEVEGDSMYPSLKNGALILTKEIPERSWHYAEGVVVAIYAEFVVVKRILKNNILNGNHIILGSDNEIYGTVTVPLSDIRALYKAKRIISSDII